MIAFATSFIGEAHELYFSLPVSSISWWEGFLEPFEKRWYHKKNVVQLYKGFLSTEKTDDESIAKFNHMFNSIIHIFHIA